MIRETIISIITKYINRYRVFGLFNRCLCRSLGPSNIFSIRPSQIFVQWKKHNRQWKVYEDIFNESDGWRKRPAYRCQSLHATRR